MSKDKLGQEKIDCCPTCKRPFSEPDKDECWGGKCESDESRTDKSWGIRYKFCKKHEPRPMFKGDTK